ncbi:MAG TPA: VWA domain-containing protein [Cyclobacteriaceae bacterium]|nr:VWA domain-containing protein [Cyclobacteriaceae bacterium]
MNDATTSWYNVDWLTLSTLRSFAWEWPLFLYLIPIVLLLFLVRWFLRAHLSQKLPVAVTQKELRTSPANLIRLLPELLLLIAVAFMLVAMARPQKTNERVDQWTEGIDIILALDISQSMQIEDFTPNRLQAAKNVARDFIDGRVQDRIGLVVFSGDAFSLAPLTTDYDLLKQYLDEVSFEMIESRGTAIGSALAVVTNRMRESTAKSKVCILLSDGDSNAGNIDPLTAAELASAYGIKIYTIVVGKEGLVPMGKDFFGRPQMYPNTIDETTLRKIATLSNGEFFRATNNQALKNVFQRIDQYEKAEIKETRYKNTADYYYIYLQWAVGIFLCWLLLKSTFLSNALQD